MAAHFYFFCLYWYNWRPHHKSVYWSTGSTQPRLATNSSFYFLINWELYLNWHFSSRAVWQQHCWSSWAFFDKLFLVHGLHQFHLLMKPWLILFFIYSQCFHMVFIYSQLTSLITSVYQYVLFNIIWQKSLSHRLPLIEELEVSLHQVEGTIQVVLFFSLQPLEYEDTYSLQSLNGNLHQLWRHPTCSYNVLDVQESWVPAT